MEERPKLRAGTIVMALAGLAVLVLYLTFLAKDFATLEGPGDSAVGNAYATLAALAALWGLLLVLLVVDQIRARGWLTRPAILLVPIAGIATLFATDYPNNRLCVWAIVALAPVVGAYLMLGWLPRRASAWAGRAQALMLLPMAALSVYPIERFIS
jgi:drug/metabolite transporter superfamily protein YnfA